MMDFDSPPAARRAGRMCAVAGCPALVRRGSTRCEAHDPRAGGQAAALDRAADHRFYQSAVWRRLRALVLRDPFDAVCRVVGCGRMSEQVDHVIPRRARPELQLVRANLQGLCQPHHAAKSAAESRGSQWVAPLRERPAPAAGG